MSEQSAVDRSWLWVALGFGVVVAASVLLLEGTTALLPAAVAAVAMVALFNRKLALYLILPAMALSPDILFHGLAIRLEDLLMIPLVLGWVAHLCVVHTRRGTPIDRLLIAYVLVAVVSTMWGVHLGTVHLLSVSKYTSSTFHVLKRAEFVLLFLVVADTLETPADVRAMSYALLVSVVALSVYSVQQFSANHGIALGPEGAPIHEPGFASMVTVALAMGMMRAAAPRAKLALAACVLFAIASLPLALGRNYIVATLLIILYVGIREQRWVFLVVPLLAALVLVVYPHGVIDRIASLQSALSTDTTLGPTPNAPTSVFYRAAAPLFYATAVLGHSPLLGYGMGVVPLGFIDSEYVIQLAYTGLVGLAIFLAFGARLVRVARDAQRMATTAFDSGLAFGFQLVIFGYAVYSVFAASVSATHTGGPFFVVAALAGVLYRSSAAERAKLAVGRGPVLGAVPVSTSPWRPAVSPRLAARQALWLRSPLLGRRTAR